MNDELRALLRDLQEYFRLHWNNSPREKAFCNSITAALTQDETSVPIFAYATSAESTAPTICRRIWVNFSLGNGGEWRCDCNSGECVHKESVSARITAGAPIPSSLRRPHDKPVRGTANQRSTDRARTADAALRQRDAWELSSLQHAKNADYWRRERAEKAEAQLAEAQKDAERWQWIVNHPDQYLVYAMRYGNIIQTVDAARSAEK